MLCLRKFPGQGSSSPEHSDEDDPKEYKRGGSEARGARGASMAWPKPGLWKCWAMGRLSPGHAVPALQCTVLASSGYRSRAAGRGCRGIGVVREILHFEVSRAVQAGCRCILDRWGARGPLSTLRRKPSCAEEIRSGFARMRRTPPKSRG